MKLFLLEISPTLGWVREDPMAPAFDDGRLWGLLAALTGVGLAVINAFCLFFERVPPRSVIEVRCARQINQHLKKSTGKSITFIN